MAYLPAFVVDFYRKNVGIPWYTIQHGSYGLITQPAIFFIWDLRKRDRSASKSFSKVFQSSGSCPTMTTRRDDFSRYPRVAPLPLEKPTDWT